MTDRDGGERKGEIEREWEREREREGRGREEFVLSVCFGDDEIRVHSFVETLMSIMKIG